MSRMLANDQARAAILACFDRAFAEAVHAGLCSPNEAAAARATLKLYMPSPVERKVRFDLDIRDLPFDAQNLVHRRLGELLTGLFARGEAVPPDAATRKLLN